MLWGQCCDWLAQWQWPVTGWATEQVPLTTSLSVWQRVQLTGPVPGCTVHVSKTLRPKIHGYTACKRTRFVEPDSVKLAMGHLLHGEAAPWNRALQTPVPSWIQDLVRRVLGGAWLFTLSLQLQSPFTWPSLQYPLFTLLQLFACKARDSTRFFMTRAMHGTWFSALGWFNPLFFEPVRTSPHPAIWLRQVGLLSSQSEPWVDATCYLKIEHPGCAENQVRVCREPSSSEPLVLSRARFASCTGQIHDTACSAEHVLLHPV